MHYRQLAGLYGLTLSVLFTGVLSIPVEAASPCQRDPQGVMRYYGDISSPMFAKPIDRNSPLCGPPDPEPPARPNQAVLDGPPRVPQGKDLTQWPCHWTHVKMVKDTAGGTHYISQTTGANCDLVFMQYKNPKDSPCYWESVKMVKDSAGNIHYRNLTTGHNCDYIFIDRPRMK